MSGARVIIGDIFQVAKTLPDQSVDLVLTSPPFLALRSYLPADDPNKGLEIGTEPTPGDYIDTLIDVVEALTPKLAPHGSMIFELGDTYAGSGGGGGDYLPGGWREGQQNFAGSAATMRESNTEHARQKNSWRYNDNAPRQSRVGRGLAANGRAVRAADEEAGLTQHRARLGPDQRDDVTGWPLDKSLCLIPELFRVALVYGINPLTGRLCARWRARNVIRWCRPNPPVGALADKFRPATSDLVVICKSRKRYFDLDAVRIVNDRVDERYVGRRRSHEGDMNRPDEGASPQNSSGAPPLDFWVISTQPYRGAHYATWPEDLLVTPIKAMCPPRVCTVCGKPSERIIESKRVRLHDGQLDPPRVSPTRDDTDNGTTAIGVRHGMGVINQTVGWTDCGHGSWRPGVVLDPFCGSGTTLKVATGHGRDAIGIDLDARNVDLIRDRVGLFLEVQDMEAPVD